LAPFWGAIYAESLKVCLASGVKAPTSGPKWNLFIFLIIALWVFNTKAYFQLLKSKSVQKKKVGRK